MENKSIKICKRVHFHAAHRLMFHQGLCRFLHGHTYQIDIIFNTLSDELPENGMYLDFSELKEFCYRVTQDLDHATLLNKRDPYCGVLSEPFYQSQSPELKERGRVICFETDPTAEAIASLILDRLIKHTTGTCKCEVYSVKVWETETSFAEVKRR